MTKKTIEYEKSFASHEKAKYWNYRLNPMGPEKYALNSHSTCWFDCDCGHSFESSLLNLNQSNNWCPYCSSPPKKICNNLECKKCFEKSFASHPKSQFWSDKNEVKPRQVFKSANRKKYLFNCVCGHEIIMCLKSISRENNWCSYCSHQKLCENENCESCFNNSFASVDTHIFWSSKNILQPRQMFKSSLKKVWMTCQTCNDDYEKILADLTRKIGCRLCKNKTEKKLFDTLIKTYPTIKREYKADWCKKIRHLPFDFVLEEYKIIVELDGNCHLKQVSNWRSPEETHENDIYKMKCARENGYSMIRILQEDVWKNKFDWLQELNNAIDKIKKENKSQFVYICKNDEYVDFFTE